MGHSFGILPDLSLRGPSGWEWYFLSIRERDKWVLTAGGERVLLYKRRYSGRRCSQYDAVRHSSVQHSDTECFGTGFVAENSTTTGSDIGGPYHGYFAPIEIVISLLSSGPEEFTKTDFGVQRVYKPHSWTLWEPLLASGDMIVRRNNQRFFVTQVFPRRMKHFITHQDFDLVEVERGNIVYTLPSGL
jgi:hypothetical protein